MTTLDLSEKWTDLRGRNTAAAARWRARQRGEDVPFLRRGRPPLKPTEAETADNTTPADAAGGPGHED